jgi:hypothetical protein
MIFNHLGVSVRKYVSGDSYCPECERQLIAKRPDTKVWHWAHKAQPSTHSACPWEESEWHLRWKAAQLKIPGWTVEHKIEIAGKRYILDAYHEETGRVREFVHSLSPYYEAKHLALKAAKFSVGWIYDGAEFVSARTVGTRQGIGLRKLLKPAASMLHGAIGGYVHIHREVGDALYKSWKNDVWYPVEAKGAEQLLAFFNNVDLKGVA